MATNDIRDRPRARHSRPEGVEQFGIEAVPAGLRTVHWLDLLAIVFNFPVNPGVIPVGRLAVASDLSS